MRSNWHVWHDVDGLNETVIALTPLRNTKIAERKIKEIKDNQNMRRQMEKMARAKETPILDSFLLHYFLMGGSHK